MKISMIWQRVKENALIDARFCLRGPVPPHARIFYLAQKYIAIAANQKSIRYLGKRLHYDNRMTPAFLLDFVDELKQVASHVDFSSVKTVFDIGANIGQYAMTLKRLYPHIVIYSFEPNHDIFEILRRNSSQVSGWHVFNFGLGDKDEDRPFFYVPGKSGQGSCHRENATVNLGETEVVETTVRLRRLTPECCAQFGIPREVDFVKIDAEGFEGQAMRALTSISFRYLTLEISSGREIGVRCEDAENLMREIWHRETRLLCRSKIQRDELAFDATFKLC